MNMITKPQFVLVASVVLLIGTVYNIGYIQGVLDEDSRHKKWKGSDKWDMEKGIDPQNFDPLPLAEELSGATNKESFSQTPMGSQATESSQMEQQRPQSGPE